MGEKWIKEAEDLKARGTAGRMDRTHNNPKVTWHVTVSPSGSRAFDSMASYLASVKSEPQILYDPLSDRLGQWFPLDTAGRALKNDGSAATNRDGRINIQIEVVAMPDGFTRYWKPGPNYHALMRAIRSWGIPDTWPAGRVATSYADRTDRSWSSYQKAGHFGHCHVPGNTHWDPGPIDQQAIFTAARGSATPNAGADRKEWLAKKLKVHSKFSKGTIMRLQAELGVTIDGDAGPDTWRAVQKWVGVTRDGIPGPETYAGLRRKFNSTNINGKWTPQLVRDLQLHLNETRKQPTPPKPAPSKPAPAKGLDVDGLWGPATKAATQNAIKVGDKGGLSASTVKALQGALNKGDL